MLSRRHALGLIGAGAVWGLTGCRADRDTAASNSGAVGLTSDVILGDHDSEPAVLTVPHGQPEDTWPLVVLFAGGFWRGPDPESLQPAVDALNRGGYATLVPPVVPLDVATYPDTFLAAAEAVDHVATLASDHAVSVDRVVVLGHGSGATMALWCAGRAGLPAEVAGSNPRVVPRLAVSIDGLTNLAASALESVGGDAVRILMGGGPASDRGANYLHASPIEALPLGVPALLVHQEDDAIVPVVQSETFAARARDAGDDITLEVVPGGHHYTALDPRSDGWTAVMAWLDERH